MDFAIIDEPAKSQKIYWSVIPAKAGIQRNQIVLDSCFRRSDGVGTFYEAAGIARCIFFLPELRC
jgi:hypothetical protein